MYETLADKSAELKADGFTDVWLPPASRGGYGVTDRYDLGEFAQGPSSVDGKTTDPTATAYGTAGQLKTLMDALHQNGMSGEEDLVTNQMMNLNERQAVLVNRTDASGNLWHASGQPQIQGHVYLSYTSNSIEWDPGQHKYGLLQWDASDFNGTSLQSQGLASAILSYPDLGAASSEYANPASSDYLTVTGTGANAKLNDKSNITDKWYKFDAAKADLSTSTMNLVESAIPGDTDTYYVPADGWYCAADCEPGGSPTWYPYLINSSSFQSWLSSSDTWSKYFSSDQPTTVDAEAIATATLKAGVKDLGVLVSDYKAAEPGYNLSSEQPSNENSNSGIDSGDQFLYVNPDGSATSKGLNQGFMKSNEMLIGSDVDNANSDVQKETQHWAKWLLDTYHFDGFRFDAASFVSTAVLQQTAKTVADEPANTGSAGKLSYIESYSDSQRSYEDSVGNPQLSYDSGLQGGLQNALGASPGQRKSLQSIATSGFVNRTDNAGSTATTPNWSFVSNHDKQKDIVYPIMMSQLGVSHGDGDNSFGSAWSDAAQNAALKTYDDDVQSVTKQYAPYNVPAQYAYMLTNIDTVPTVYYGDLYQPDGDYMSQKTPYYDIITKLVNARKQLNAGGQKVLGFPSNTSSTSGGDLIASVRAGTDRSTGGVTVIGSNANLDTSITIPLGAGHANQMYRDVSGLHDEEISTDANGNLRLSIKGSATPTVNGYLGVWAPDTSAPDPTVAPTASDASATTDPGKAVTLDPDTTFGTSQTFTGVAFDKSGATTKDVPGEGTWTIALNDKGQPEAVFTPEDGFTGKTTPVPYIVTDGNGLTATANLDVTVNKPLTPPTTGDKSATTNPDTPVTLNPVTTPGSGDITDVKFVAPADGKGSLSADGKTLTVPGEGVWTIKLDDKGQPVATFAPDKDYSGPVTEQSYTVTDANELTATGKLDVTINEPPSAKDKSATTNPKTPVTLDPETGFGTSQKFTGVAFDDKGATTKTVPGEGTWTIKLGDNGQPTAVFTPVGGFTGKTTAVPYIVTDGNGLTATANLDVTVLAPPTASDKSATTDPKTPVTLDPDTTFGTSQKFTSVAFDDKGATTKDVPGEGTWTIKLNDKGQPEAVFTPVDGFTGKTTPVPYTVTDGNGLTATANLDVTVLAPPTTGDASKAINPNETATLTPKTVPGSGDITDVTFTDPAATDGGKTLTVPGEGTWTIKLGDNGQPTAVFTPVDGFTGKTTAVPYIVTDENGLTATANLDVTVLAPPTASDKSATTDPKTPVTLDPETGFGTSKKFTGVAFDDKGATTKDVPGEGSWTISLNDKGQPEAVFTPVDGFTGKTTPQPYTVTDENGLTATANLDVTVNKPLTPPTTGDKSATTNPDTPVTLNPVTTPGSAPIKSVVFDNNQPTKDVPGQGTWTIELKDGQPVATFTPDKDFTGKVTPQKYTVTDSNDKTADGTLNVTINPPAPVPPKTGDKSATTNPGKPVTLNPVTTPGSSPITSVAFDNGQLTKDVPGEGTWTVKLKDGQPVAVFTPEDGFTGKTTPQPYTVTDENGLTATGKLDVTVNTPAPVTPPTTGDRSETGEPGKPVTLNPVTKPGSAPIKS
ncbi:glycoside hydrolase family 70 protein, partial [Bifidobacterium tibiigranuli]|uniref:glycoside hydrolase family 70 protein n=1 Tax=Bifidobacterium tibiigranuli TaxID=2172043 RepID=UPI0026EDF62E